MFKVTVKVTVPSLSLTEGVAVILTLAVLASRILIDAGAALMVIDGFEVFTRFVTTVSILSVTPSASTGMVIVPVV
ncbi:hypothetical protein D3C87_716030 [compost metagenome]